MVITGLFIGILLGFILQRGRFCVTGAFRDVWVAKNSWWLGAFFIAISVQAVGLAIFNSTGFLPTETAASPFAPVATVAGGFIFGIGMLLAGGCPHRHHLPEPRHFRVGAGRRASDCLRRLGLPQPHPS